LALKNIFKHSDLITPVLGLDWYVFFFNSSLYNEAFISVPIRSFPGGRQGNRCFCAKAKRQQQLFFVRKRSGSKRVLSVRKRSASVAAATTNFFCEKMKYQRQH